MLLCKVHTNETLQIKLNHALITADVFLIQIFAYSDVTCMSKYTIPIKIRYD